MTIKATSLLESLGVVFGGVRIFTTSYRSRK